MKIFTLVGLIIFFSISIYGQGEFLERGTWGVSAGGGISSNENAKGSSVGLGFSNGTIELSTAYGSVNPKTLPPYTDFSGTATSINLAIYLVKDKPINLAIRGGYEQDKVTIKTHYYYGGYPINYEYTATADFYTISGYIGGTIKAGTAAKILPFITLTYVDPAEGTGSAVYSFGISGGFYITPNFLIAVTPGITISQNITTYGLSANLVYAFSK